MKRTSTLAATIVFATLSFAAVGCAGPASPTESAGQVNAPSVATLSIAASPTPAPSPSFAGQVIEVVAKDRLFSLSEITVAPGAAFEIRLDNQDPFEHAIYITKGVREVTPGAAEAGSSLFKGAYVTGPASLTYDVAGLDPGTYTFFCPPHPPMTGTIVVK